MKGLALENLFVASNQKNQIQRTPNLSVQLTLYPTGILRLNFSLYFLTPTCTEENSWAEKFEKELKRQADETDG